MSKPFPIFHWLIGFSLLSAQGCCLIVPKPLNSLNDSIHQAIIVHPVKQGSSQAQLSTWQKRHHIWHRQLLTRAVIGRQGLSLPGAKKEGDGKTPWGTYALGPAFGYAPSMNTGLVYRQATDLDFWVDDEHSMQYNQWVKGPPQARSFEKMKRPDHLYQYGIVINYNMHPIIPGRGSAIFMHVWRNYYSPTAGCVALNQRYLRKILHWLRSEENPIIILE